eukprot:TRINITY_DN5925_c0_g1_i2.p1 TRINITY_DN5925_c0_g1~~TRINITY_DN5925_c0_g1_i2.p1  ORF type:complete len:466 (-),score=130.57 TRINITY_DN5925_c0_g1_i2:70-1467(-)
MVVPQACNLMRFNRKKALAVLVHPDMFDALAVAHALVKPLSEGGDTAHRVQDEENLLAYMDELYKKFPEPNLGLDMYKLQVELYCKHNPDALMSFLEESTYIPMDEAIKICDRYKMYKEEAHVLGRIGLTKGALRIYLDKLKDIRAALVFVQSQNDPQLFNDFIRIAVKEVRYVSSLLDGVNVAYIDPIMILRNIPPGMQIPKLIDKLMQIVSDYKFELQLRKGCIVVLKSDGVKLLHSLYNTMRRGYRIEAYERCPVCDNIVITRHPSEDAVVFLCGHTFHRKCLKAPPAATDDGPNILPTDPPEIRRKKERAAEKVRLAKTKTVFDHQSSSGYYCAVCRSQNEQEVEEDRPPQDVDEGGVVIARKVATTKKSSASPAAASPTATAAYAAMPPDRRASMALPPSAAQNAAGAMPPRSASGFVAAARPNGDRKRLPVGASKSAAVLPPPTDRRASSTLTRPREAV